MISVRTLINTERPLISPKGDVLANTDIVFQLVDEEKRQPIMLFDAAPDGGQLVVGNGLTATTDENGLFSVDLWTNNRGEAATLYKVSIPSVQLKPFYIRVVEGSGPLQLVDAKASVDATSPQVLSLFDQLLQNILEVVGQISSVATSTVSGIMSYVDKAKLDLIRATETWPTLLDAITAFGSNTVTLNIYTNQTLGAPLTVPANVELVFHNGAKLIHGAHTIAVNSSTRRWPLAEVLDGTGAVKLAGEVYPCWFTGTGAQKVQKALDTALNHTYASNEEFNQVGFDREYDITGSTVYFKKANASNTADRRMLTLIGKGGGLKKTDAGFFFDFQDPVQPPTGSAAITGDITAKGLTFVSTSGAGATVWNSDKLIRWFSIGCTYRGVDYVFAARGPRGVAGFPGLAQSVTMRGDTVTGGRGWVGEFVDSSDVTIDDVTVEYRASGPDVGGFRNYQVDSVTPQVLNSALRIVNCVIEGIPGKAIRLGSCSGTTIAGNYFEYNYEDIDLKTDSYIPHYGVVVMGNFFNDFSPSAPDLTKAHIQWGILGPGATSVGNFFSGQPSHHISATQTGTTGVLLSSGDRGTLHADTVGSAYYRSAAGIEPVTSGTWTPSITGSITPGAHTYGTRYGTYVRKGNQVTINCIIAMTAKDAAMSGTVSITGLPFASIGTYFPAAIGRMSNVGLTAGKFGKGAAVYLSAIELNEWTSGGPISLETVANVSNTSLWSISATYTAA